MKKSLKILAVGAALAMAAPALLAGSEAEAKPRPGVVKPFKNKLLKRAITGKFKLAKKRARFRAMVARRMAPKAHYRGRLNAFRAKRARLKARSFRKWLHKRRAAQFGKKLKAHAFRKWARKRRSTTFFKKLKNRAFRKWLRKLRAARFGKLGKRRFKMRHRARFKARIKARLFRKWLRKHRRARLSNFAKARIKTRLFRKWLKRRKAARLRNLRKKFRQRTRYGWRS